MRITKLKHLALAACLLAFLPGIFAACGRQQIRADIVTEDGGFRAGETVRLFHGGTKEAKTEFCLGETIPVYRWAGRGRYVEYKEVAKVKITRFVGEHYFDAQVVEGEVRQGDLVRKATAACLIVPMEKPE